MTTNFDEKPFALRGPQNEPEWFCRVAGKLYGPWPDKGSATAGYETEKRRTKKRQESRYGNQQ